MKWSATNEGTVREIVRQGEVYLHAQLSIATSGDQRSSVMASIFTAAGAAIVAGLLTLSSDGGVDLTPLFWGGGAAAALFLTGAALCVWAALPVGFWLPGQQPSDWTDDVASGQSLRESLEEQAEHYQSKIDDNRRTLKANARFFKVGALLGISAPICGLLFWIIFSGCR